MLGASHSLYFPKLVYLNEVSIDRPSGVAQNIALYRLDWSQKELLVEAKQRHSLETAKESDRIKLTLPVKYDNKVNQLRFALRGSYLREIRRNTKAGLHEWNVQRAFDTNVREYCLKTAEAHIFVAFYLLADCIFDISEGYFDRNDDKFIIKHVMAYKFWCGQTGDGCVREHAQFDMLDKNTHWAQENGNVRSAEIGTQLLKSIEKTEQVVFDSYKQEEKEYDGKDS